MQHPFVEFLSERDLVPTKVVKRLSEKKRFVREPIGMIAAAHGLIHPNEIDVILDRQRDCPDRFGEIAIELGFLSPEEVQTLLKIQEFRTPAHIAEALALAGVLPWEDAVQYLGTFLMRDREVMAMISDE